TPVHIHVTRSKHYCLSSIFFFQCSATHPHLHSFPTRRSSDLPTTNTGHLLERRLAARLVDAQFIRGEHREMSPVRAERGGLDTRDRKSTRLNSSHLGISYAVFCLKKKKKKKIV